MATLFVGLDNPQSPDPRYALFPYPPGCAGNRILSMMREADPAVTMKDYMVVPKTNLFSVGMMPKPMSLGRTLATASARLIMEQRKNSGDRLVLFGTEVRDAFMRVAGLEDMKEMQMYETSEFGVLLCWVPHPSGRNRWYNTRGRTKRVGKFLIEVVTS